MPSCTSFQRMILAATGVGACAAVAALGPALAPDQPQTLSPAASQPEGLDPATAEDLRYARGLSRAFNSAAEAVEPSVVHITTTSDRIARDLFGRRFRQEASGLGSGVIVTNDGYILTNNHVVAGATQLLVKLFDGRTVEAELIGGDELRDLAVIKIDASGLTPARLGDSSSLEVGEWVLALGSPFGFDQSVTAGIVSAKGRGLGIVSDEFKDAEQFIQTDAAINPGNSGGPLINLDGEVVGINSAIFSRSGGSVGLGFSIPIDLARVVYSNIVEGGRVDFGFLGVRFDGDAQPRIAEVFENTPAARAGLRPGDRVVRYQGRQVEDSNQLMRAIQFTPPGSEAAIEVVRDGAPVELRTRIGSLIEGQVQQYNGREIPTLGLTVVDASTAAGAESGAYVLEVEPGSLAEQRGLRRGDIVMAVNRQAVQNASEFAEQISRAGRTLRIDIERGELRGYTTIQR